MSVPETSTTLLAQLAADTRHARWAEFVSRYRPLMEAYLRQHHPSVDAEEVVAETLVALCAALKDYRYEPESSGRFHNYLIGILKHKAWRLMRTEVRYAKALARYADEQAVLSQESEEDWRKVRLATAVDLLLADESVQERTKQAFVRTALNGEAPQAVAESLGVTRNAVDQMKSRAVTRLKEIVAELERAEGR